MIALYVLPQAVGLFGRRIERLGRSCIWLRTAQNFRFYMLLVMILAWFVIGNGASLSLSIWDMRVGTRSGAVWGRGLVLVLDACSTPQEGHCLSMNAYDWHRSYPSRTTWP